MKKVMDFLLTVWADTMKPNGKYSRKSFSWVLSSVLFVLHTNYAVFWKPELLASPNFIELVLIYVGMGGFWGVMTYVSKKNLPYGKETTPKEDIP